MGDSVVSQTTISKNPRVRLMILALAGISCAASVAAQPAPGAGAPARPPAASTAPTVPPGVIAHRDLPYLENGHDRQKLDLYLPADGEGPFPVVAWIHGGGWAAGDKNGCPPLSSGFVARGYAAVSIGYRLSGDAIFPAQIQDCKAALRWLRANAQKFQLDPNRIGVWGSSAGGHLAALLGTSGGVSEFDVGENPGQPSHVQAVVDFYGPTDFLQMDAHAVKGATLIHDSERSPESRLVGGPIRDNVAKVQRANPITYVGKDDPPFLIVHGDRDPAVPHHQSKLLYDALVRTGVPVRFVTVAGGGHGQGFPHAELLPLVREFLDRHLKGNKDAANWPVAMTSKVKATEPAPAPGDTKKGAGQRDAGGPPPWDVIVGRDDADRDGRLSRAEFKGPAPLFDRLDANRDGMLTREEHEEGLRARARR